MKSFLDLLQDILDHGVRKINRTGTDTIGVIGRQLRFDLRKGFPLVTTRPIYTRGLIEENLMFIRGSTDNNELTSKDVNIWSKWALPEDVYVERGLPDHARASLLARKLEGSAEYPTGEDVIRRLNKLGYEAGTEWINKEDIPTTEKILRYAAGELGPIYGYLWRFWPCSDGRRIDQLAEAIELLRSNPYSRRNIITAWCPEVLPDEGISPQQNVANGRQCLAACHTFFKFSVTPSQTASEPNAAGEIVVGRPTLNLHLFQRKLDCALAA